MGDSDFNWKKNFPADLSYAGDGRMILNNKLDDDAKYYTVVDLSAAEAPLER
jgi:hypothetical protein